MSGLQRHQLQVAFVVGLIVFPFLPGASGYLRMATEAAQFTIIAASLVMLTGWVGQISLGHAALVGIGAYATGFASAALGLNFPLNLPVAMLAGGAVAALLGVIALRVRGLYLAVATLIFSWAASEFLFRQGWLLEYSTVPSQQIGTPGTLLALDFTSTQTFYFIAWATAVAVLFALANLRDSKTGRALFAVRGSEMAAASLGMDVLRYKALSFALSGALAGLAGNLLMSNARVVSPESCDFNQSLFYLAIAVVGGLSSLAGAVAAAWLFAIMGELFFRIEFLNAYLQLVSAGLLALVFRVYPGGLASMGRQIAALGKRAGQAIAVGAGRAGVTIRERVHAIEAAKALAEAEGPAEDTIELDVEDDATGRLAGSIRRSVGVPARALGRVLLLPAAVVVHRLDARAERHGLTVEGPIDLSLQDRAAITAPSAAAPTPAPVVVSGDNVVPFRDDGRPRPNGDGPKPAGDHGAAATADVGSAPEDGPRIETGTSSTWREAVAQAQRGPLPVSNRHERRKLVEARNITVRFGGLTAVNDATLEVREGEIVGLIGPNGAGKTTLFNSIAGFNEPTEGRVFLYDQDVTPLSIHERAQLGLARTFQLIQLFPQLTVFENLLAATHLQNPTGFVQHLIVTPHSLSEEAAARERVHRVLDILDLHEVSDMFVSNLPFGILRMVEVARTLVTGARVVMLDEPASGLDETETDHLTDVLRVVNSLGATLLLIEHDVRMVTSVTDYMYVLDRGTLIAEGSSQQVQNDPKVISAYLGEPAEKQPAEKEPVS